MISDRPYSQSWRPAYELYAASVWFFATAALLVLAVITPSLLVLCQMTAAVTAVMTLLRLVQALPQWQKHRRLKGKPVSFLSLNQRHCQQLQKQSATQGLWLGWGFEWQRQHGQHAWDLLRSDNLPEKSKDRMGSSWIHGLNEREETLFQPLDQIQMHTLVIGVPGSGKTRLFDLLITQAILRNEPVIIIDPKGDKDLANHSQRSCERSGSRDRFIQFHPGFPETSVRINLLQNFNRSSELASRISGLMPSSGDSASFQAFAQKAVDAVVQGYLICGRRPTLVMIRQGLEGGVAPLLIQALTIICNRHQSNSHSVDQTVRKNNKKPNDNNPDQLARHWVNMYRTQVMPTHPCTDVEGLISLFEHDRAHFSKMIATLLPALGMLTGGPLAQLLSPDPTAIEDTRPCSDTSQLIDQNKVVYFGLDSLSDPMVGKAIGQLLLADLAAVAGDRYNYSSSNTHSDINNPYIQEQKPINLFVDEAAEVLCPQLLSLLNKGRGAQFRLTIATQTLSDFEAQLGSKAAADQLIDNCNHLICLRTQNPDTQQFITRKLPTVRYRYFTRTQGVRTDAHHPLDFSGNLSEQQLEETGELFPSQLLGELPNLEYLARLGGGRLLKGRIPILCEPKQSWR